MSDSQIDNYASYTEDALQIYATYEPSGEILLSYHLPIDRDFAPLAQGRFCNASKFLLRSSALWAFALTVLFSSFVIWDFWYTASAAVDAARAPIHEPLSPHPSSLYQSPWTVVIGMLLGLLVATPLAFLVVFLVLVPLMAIIYLATMSLNLFCQFGKDWTNRLNAPTQISLSKASMKLLWTGRFFTQYGGILKWADVLGVDYQQAEDPTVAPCVDIKYKFPEPADPVHVLFKKISAPQATVFPVSLDGFSDTEQARFFMSFVNKYAPDEVKTEAFRRSITNIDETLALTQSASVDYLLSAQPSPHLIAMDKLQEAAESSTIELPKTESDKVSATPNQRTP